jgi:hypothetical protein
MLRCVLMLVAAVLVLMPTSVEAQLWYCNHQGSPMAVYDEDFNYLGCQCEFGGACGHCRCSGDCIG